ncbi:sodium:solute symporter family protein [Pseudodesulfovibrio sp. JC047]|uniref:sodium:solute symporter family protein n=1 Tax=Pseudodesulfovibrio sp. JC047 TaxID=2683199 RepID=UPI0013D051F2|nr:sodium:solute symporter family protein [Pseudodesulfovibrio sp. JC047]NDV18395.1 sodium:solute symporter family protein [Pseudodesulfovibrio sp. JC047]
MNIYTIGVLCCILIYIIIGFYAGRKIENVEDYYVCGRNAPTIMIAGTMFASMLSTNGFMGDTAYCFTGNITTMILINALCACGYVVGPLLFGRYLRRAKVNTMPSYFWRRFNSKRIRRFAGITTVISLSAYLLSVIQGTGILMETLTGYDKTICLLIAWFCITFFTIYSGSRGVVITDTLMCIFFLAATIIAGPFVFNASGGLGNLITTLATSPDTPAGLLDYHGNTGGKSPMDMIMYAITIGCVWMLAVSVSPWQAGRNMMAKSEHVIFRSGAISAFLTVFFLLYLYLIAISIIPLHPNIDKPEKILIWAAFEIMPQLIGVVLLTGIMTAGLSSASTFLSVVSFSISSDVMDINFKDEKAQLEFTRFAVLVVGLMALGLACLELSSIRIITWFASTIIASSWGVVAIASVWSKKLTERGAYYSMVGGFFCYLIAKILKEVAGLPLNNLLDPFFIGIALSAVLAILGSRGQKRTPEEAAFHTKLHEVPASEIVISDYKKDTIYGWGLVGAGILISSIFIIYWAIPYNTIKGIDLLSFLN